MTTDLLHDFVDHGIEAKLELIESQLIVGNTLVSSRFPLKQILLRREAIAAIAF